MTDDGSKEGSTWPMPKSRFEVDTGNRAKKRCIPRSIRHEQRGTDY